MVIQTAKMTAHHGLRTTQFLNGLGFGFLWTELDVFGVGLDEFFCVGFRSVNLGDILEDWHFARFSFVCVCLLCVFFWELCLHI